MSWWQDGTSNQIVIGEKHIATDWLGQCPQGAAWGDLNNTPALISVGDCSYLMAGDNYETYSTSRAVVRGNNSPGTQGALLLQRPTEPSVGRDNAAFSFGSWHPGICPFLFGDGSVHSLAIMTSGTVLQALGEVDDGVSVSLP